MKAVLFDWEGTLVDFQWNLRAATQEAQRALARLGWPSAEMPDHYALLRNEAVQWAARTGRNEREIQRCIDEVYDRYDLDACSRWSLQPGVAALLKTLKAKGVQVGLVSNIGRVTVDRALNTFGVASHFDCIVTRNEVEMLKPSGEGIRRALEQLGARPSEVLFVGDSVSDIQAAHDAGVPVAIVQGGENAPASLIAAGPTFLFASIRELETVYAAA